jgi:hypothetical protein
MHMGGMCYRDVGSRWSWKMRNVFDFALKMGKIEKMVQSEQFTKGNFNAKSKKIHPKIYSSSLRQKLN